MNPENVKVRERKEEGKRKFLEELIDGFKRHVNQSRLILCLVVSESHLFYIHNNTYMFFFKFYL